LVAHLIRNPILKVLSSIQTHRVQALLMGGQACVFYGAAEFSRTPFTLDVITLKPSNTFHAKPQRKTQSRKESNLEPGRLCVLCAFA